MAIRFTINDEVIVGRVVPGSARVRLYNGSRKDVAAFDPYIDSLLTSNPRRVWSEINPKYSEEKLQTIEADVLKFCRARLLRIQRNSKK